MSKSKSVEFNESAVPLECRMRPGDAMDALLFGSRQAFAHAIRNGFPLHRHGSANNWWYDSREVEALRLPVLRRKAMIESGELPITYAYSRVMELS